MKNRQYSRRSFIKLAGTAAVAGIGFPAIVRAKQQTKNIILLGIDGMDGKLLKQAIEKNIMPNTVKLLSSGSLSDIRTSDPPQSPVAWSNVISGTNPGGHNIFDFITRDPSTLTPRFSASRTESSQENMRLGNWKIPLTAGRTINLRKGPTFWNFLDKHDINSTILRMPANFPPTKTKAHTLSGLGTPDIHGSYGIFTLFTDSPGEKTRDMSGGHIERVKISEHVAQCVLPGPVNTLSVKAERVTIPFKALIDPSNPLAKIIIQNNEFILKEGEWSDWIRVKFPLISHIANISGICRFFLKSVRNNFSLYVSPVNMDPTDPSLPISTPARYSSDLARNIGMFYTQGMPQDTSALSSGVFNDDEYRQQATYVLDEELRLFQYGLDNFTNGFFFSYFSSLDLNSHAFWRTLDTGHPLYTPELAAKHGDFLPWLYGKMDSAIGQAMQRLDDKTSLIIISDHGLKSFRRQFNLNSWLMDNGYAAAQGAARGTGTFFADTNWERTRAYGLGINSLYLNIKGREPYGCVKPGAEQESITREIIARLKAVKDPKNGERVICNVYRPSEIYSGPYTQNAPDLTIGYNVNYRASWDTILGKYPSEHLQDNTDTWSGDHTMDSRFMAGVLMSNRKIKSNHPALIDVAPTILQEYGIPIPPEMTGKPFFG